MATTLFKPITGLATTLAAPHVAFDGALVLAAGDGLLFGSLAANRVFRVVALSSPGTAVEEILGIFEATGIAGDTLTGVTSVEGTTDVPLPSGTNLEVRATAKAYSAIQDALNSAETTLATVAASQVVDEGNIASNSAAIALKANDSAVVHLAGAESITGTKTFSTLPVLGSLTGLLKATAGTPAAAVAGTDYLAPTGSGAALTGIVASQVGGVPTGLLKGVAAAFAAATAGTDYVAPGGVVGGQTVNGGTGSAEALNLLSTTHATKGNITLNSAFVVGAGGNVTITSTDATTSQWKVRSATGQGAGVKIVDIGDVGGGLLFGVDKNGLVSVPTMLQAGSAAGANTTMAGGGFTLQTVANIYGQLGTGTNRGGTAVLLLDGNASLSRPIYVGKTFGVELGPILTTLNSASPVTAQGATGQTAPLVVLQLKSSTSADRNAAIFDAAWATSTDASRKGRGILKACDSTGTDRVCFTGESDGTQPMVGLYGAAAVAKQTVTGSRGGNAALTSVITALANLGAFTDSTTA
jgi:hypothetical protein